MRANLWPYSVCYARGAAYTGMACLASALIALGGAGAAEQTLHVRETRLIMRASDGVVLALEALIGVELTIVDPAHGGHITRINAIEADPLQPDLTLYDVSFRHPKTGQWEQLCRPGPAGLSRAVPIPGYWRRDGSYAPLPPGEVTWTCTAGAHVKCLRLGYYPWASTEDGLSLQPYHQACMRMIRADYCGNGTSFTVAGKHIQVADMTGERHHSAKRYGVFEAVWGVHGAVCVRRARVPDQFPLEHILQACPSLGMHTGEHCREDGLYRHPNALLANWSEP